MLTRSDQTIISVADALALNRSQHDASYSDAITDWTLGEVSEELDGGEITVTAARPNWFQRLIDPYVNSYTNWNANRTADYVRGNDYHDRRGTGGVVGYVLRRADNVVFGVTQPIFAIPTAIGSIVSHPQGAVLAFAGAVDRNLIYGPPARVQVANAWSHIANNSAAENTILFGEVAGTALTGGGGRIARGLSALRTVRAAESATPVMRGIAFENSGVAAAQSEAFLANQSVRRLSVRAFDDAGNLLPGRTVLDLAGNRATGQLGALEFKLSEGVSLTARQAEHFPYLARNGGIVVGENGQLFGLPNRAAFGPLDVQRISGPTLPLTWWPK